jgi:peptidoglycan hydrolase-like protein with peptidoglycan-binding domain
MSITDTAVALPRDHHRRSRRVGLGALSVALGLTLLTPAPAGAAMLAPEHLVDVRAAGNVVSDAAIADPMAVTGAIPMPEGVLARGDTGNAVAWVQKVLGVPMTGFYGPKTAAAVAAFQEKAGASAGTGIVGPLTRLQLKALEKQQIAAAKRAAARKAAAAKAAAAAAARKAAAAAASRDESRPAPAPAPSTSTSDPTMTSAARTSRAAREAVSFSAWLASPHGRMIVRRESGGSCTIVSPSGAYRGKWQMGAPFWSSYGGLAYASTPDRASCSEQDRVAYRGWIASWWYPWGG